MVNSAHDTRGKEIWVVIGIAGRGRSVRGIYQLELFRTRILIAALNPIVCYNDLNGSCHGDSTKF